MNVWIIHEEASITHTWFVCNTTDLDLSFQCSEEKTYIALFTYDITIFWTHKCTLGY